MEDASANPASDNRNGLELFCVPIILYGVIDQHIYTTLQSFLFCLCKNICCLDTKHLYTNVQKWREILRKILYKMFQQLLLEVVLFNDAIKNVNKRFSHD